MLVKCIILGLADLAALFAFGSMHGMNLFYLSTEDARFVRNSENLLLALTCIVEIVKMQIQCPSKQNFL